MSVMDPRPGVRIFTWGCQMNEEDSEQLGLLAEQAGYRVTDDLDDARLVLLNTCSVRKKPEEKVYSLLGDLSHWKAAHPDGLIGVCGCMVQVRADTILTRAPQVDFVLGTAQMHQLPEVLQQYAQSRPRIVRLSLPERAAEALDYLPERHPDRPAQLRAHVPVMYGCDRFCTFCVVPLTRGRERSRPMNDILAEIKRLADAGTREVTLLGQTVNSYGKRLPDGERTSFAELLRQTARIPGIWRIRFTAPYPIHFTDELIETMAALPQVCEHVHLPLQAADDLLLRSMKRGYTVEQYDAIVRKLRAAMPDIAITTDLMIGHPGETDEQYENTLRYVEQVRFDSAFMFAYSPRPGTRAAEQTDQIPRDVKRDRLSRLIALQNRITLEINTAQAGHEYEVLVDGPSGRQPGQLTGFTRQFKTVNVYAPDTHIGQVVRVRTTSGHPWGFRAELVQ